MLYFKKLLQTRDYLFNEVNVSDFSEQEKFVWDKQKEIITEICTFVFSFNWLQQKKAKDFMKEVVRCNFNYEELIARTGRPYTSIRATISIRNAEAERLVGGKYFRSPYERELCGGLFRVYDFVKSKII